jgi:DnaJ like chaperone protein
MIGKIIGGTIGFAMGGPIGAIAGAVFGHAYDASKEMDYAESHAHRIAYRQRDQLTFFVASFSMLAKLAGSDGQITREEVTAVERFISQDLKLSMESRKIAMDVFLAAIRSPEPFEAFAGQFYNEFAHHPQMLELMVDILFRVSVADISLTQKEESLIQYASRIFKLSPSQYERIKSRYVSSSEKYYKILKSSPNDSMEQIKSQYRKLASEYHPDKITAKGLPDEFVQLANERFKEIQTAYEEIKRERGVK